MLYPGFETHVTTLRELLLARAHRINPNPDLPRHLPGDYLNFLGERLPDPTATLDEILTTRVRGTKLPANQGSSTGLPLMFGFKFTDLLNDTNHTMVAYDSLARTVERSHLNSTAEGCALAPLLAYLDDAEQGFHTSELQPSGEFITYLAHAFEIAIGYMRNLPAPQPAKTLA